MKRMMKVSLAAILPLLLLMVNSAASHMAFGQELPPGPKTIYRSSLPGLTIQGEFELINLILDFAPGSATPPHTHGGPGIVTVLTEEIVFGMEGKPDMIAKPGEFYPDLPGTVHTAANKSSSPARVSYMIALPKGAPLTTVVGGVQAAAQQPQSGPQPAAQQPIAAHGGQEGHVGMPRTGASHLPVVLILLLPLVLAASGVSLKIMRKQVQGELK